MNTKEELREPTPHEIKLVKKLLMLPVRKDSSAYKEMDCWEIAQFISDRESALLSRVREEYDDLYKKRIMVRLGHNETIYIIRAEDVKSSRTKLDQLSKEITK